MRPLVAIALAAALLSGCARPPAPAPPPVTRIVVLTPSNHTGDTLLVAGGSLIERYALGSARLTVPDLLQVEARELLSERGIQVADPPALAAVDPENLTAEIGALAAAKFDGAALRLEVWRWEPDGDTQPVSILVGLDATLIEVASGRTLWHWRRPLGPIATAGAATLGVAHQIAARAAVAEVLASWRAADAHP